MGKDSDPDYFGSLRRLLILISAGLLLALFLVWRIDNARVEQFRVTLLDRVTPGFEWTLRPVAATARMIADLRAWRRVYQQNEELRREVQRMQGWREAAL
ncbi:MAG: rod shape-determining protein MreC, partial [Rhodobacteraceae bacterium]|nr:rod shape-determining protein MreC [Paracoccaceae bacterium]